MATLTQIYDSAINNLARGVKVRCVTKVAQCVLLNQPHMVNGKSFEVTAKSLGAGVYELTAKEV